MKKYTVIQRNAENELTEVAYFADNSTEIKAMDGYVTTTKSERVKHPSPDIMQRVLLMYQLNKTAVDLATFYKDCDNVAAALEAATPETDNA